MPYQGELLAVLQSAVGAPSSVKWSALQSELRVYCSRMRMISRAYGGDWSQLEACADKVWGPGTGMVL